VLKEGIGLALKFEDKIAWMVVEEAWYVK
jgi:hypothetical protein